MTQKSYGLSMLQDDQFRSIIHSQTRNPKVEDICLKYYSEFKKQQSSIQSDKIQLYIKCAYYLAEKSQWITDMNGAKIRNAGLSLNDMLKKHSLEDIMITLKDYSRRIVIEDPETLDDLQKLIKEISFLITFYSKFEKVLVKLEMKDESKPYAKTLSEFIWLLYIEAKNKLLNRSLELIDNTCMLAHVLCFVLVYSWDYYQPGLFTKGDNNLMKCTSRKQVKMRIHEKILEFFLIKNLDFYKNIAERFENYFSYLKNKEVIKIPQGKENFVSPELIQGNYKRMDSYYEKKLDYNYLDERIFFKDRISNMTPGKFTPFARQRVHIPNKKIGGNLSGLTDRTVQQANYNSHRILNYEAMQAQIQQISTNDVPPADIKFPKNIMQTPLNTITPLIQQTPYTTGMMMYNYVNDLTSRLNKNFVARQVDQLIFDIIDQILPEAIRNENIKSIEIKRNQVFSVYKLVAEEFGSANPAELESPEIMKAILLVAMEVVFFVSNIDFSFDKLEQRFDLSYISLWRAVDFFLKFDKSMPTNIRVHLLDVEVDIISEKIWKDEENIANIHNFLNNDKFTSKEIETIYERICKRILHQIAFQIIQLCKNLLQTREQQEKISQIAFDIMKQVLLNHPYIIWQNNFDQIIMCTLFSVFRAFKFPIKFMNIRETYISCNAHLSDEKKNNIFTSIEYDLQNVPEANRNDKKDIIGFYNFCYIIEMNQFVKLRCQASMNADNGNNGSGSSRPQTQRALQPKDVNALLQSPLSGIIPRDVNYGIKKVTGNPTTNNGNKMMAHMKGNNTTRLHAYTQSPLLRNEIVPVKNPIQSRKAINFQETEKLLIANNSSTTTQTTTKKDPLNDTARMYQQNAQTSNFFNKKYGGSTKPTTKLAGYQTTPLLIKSPTNTTPNNMGTLSPSNHRHDPSPIRGPDPMVKENSSNNYNTNIYYTTKRDYVSKGGINLNVK